MRTLLIPALLLSTALFARAAIAEDDAGSEAHAKSLVSGTDEDERFAAGTKLAREDPNALADALEEIVKAKRPGDAKLIARIAVQVKPAQVRLLLVWAASRLDGAAEAFAERIDNDHPNETMRAAEALGFLGDPSSAEKLLVLLRGNNELIAVEAARALARIATKKQTKDLVDAALAVDSAHVRLHIAWALRDVLKSGKAAIGMFAKYQGQRGTNGFRAKEAVSLLEDDQGQPLDYKVKLDEVKNFFGKRAGKRAPPVSGPDDYKPQIEKALQELAQQAPDWFHLIAVSVKEITITGNEVMFDFNRGSLNLRLRDMINWKDKEGNLRLDVACFYMIRYATILFLQKMGDASEGHRGWEEGIMAGWWYAIDFTKIAVDEQLYVYLKSILEAKPPPW